MMFHSMIDSLAFHWPDGREQSAAAAILQQWE
jgi:hypothetical protein